MPCACPRGDPGRRRAASAALRPRLYYYIVFPVTVRSFVRLGVTRLDRWPVCVCVARALVMCVTCSLIMEVSTENAHFRCAHIRPHSTSYTHVWPLTAPDGGKTQKTKRLRLSFSSVQKGHYHGGDPFHLHRAEVNKEKNATCTGTEHLQISAQKPISYHIS